tara:strand:- start:3972 stop:5030 length:1059 start_codon:yes stop_codon:yes gene_type:complete
MEKKRLNGKIKLIDNDHIMLMSIFILMARQLKLIIYVTLIFTISSIIYVQFFAIDLYQSISKVRSASGNTSHSSGLAAQFGLSLPNQQTEMNWVYPEVVKSQTIAKLVLNREFDTQRFGLSKKLFQILLADDKIKNLDFNKNFLDAFNSFTSMISISKNEKNGISSIIITTFEAKLAADVNQALIEELDSYQKSFNRKKTSKARQFISERIIDIEKELLLSEEKLKEFIGGNRRIQNSPTLLLGQQRLQREVSVLTSVFTTLKQQLETTKIEEVKESDYIVVIDPPLVPDQKIWPRKRSIVLMYLFLGTFAGVCMGFIKEFFINLETDTKNKFILIKKLILKNLNTLFSIKE